MVTFKSFEVRRSSHGLSLHQMIVQMNLDCFYWSQNLVLGFPEKHELTIYSATKIVISSWSRKLKYTSFIGSSLFLIYSIVADWQLDSHKIFPIHFLIGWKRCIKGGCACDFRLYSTKPNKISVKFVSAKVVV